MKTATITYWISVSLLGLFLIPGVFFIDSEASREGMTHLQLPDWFRWELGVLKPIGAIVLLLPFVGNRIKEWAFVCLAMDFLSASYAFLAVDGIHSLFYAPLVTLALLIVAYWAHHKIHRVFAS